MVVHVQAERGWERISVQDVSVRFGGIIALGYGLSALASLHPRMVDIVVPWWAVLLGFPWILRVGRKVRLSCPTKLAQRGRKRDLMSLNLT